jgi:hypothetical protein
MNKLIAHACRVLLTSLLSISCLAEPNPQALGQGHPTPAINQPSTPAAEPSTQPQTPGSQPATASPLTGPHFPGSAVAHPRNSYRKLTIDDKVRQFAKALDLNEAQQAGLKAVLERQQVQAKQIQFDPSLSGQERIGRFRALQNETVLHIRALLNDEQEKKYDPLGRGKQEEGFSDKYVDQWMKTHQHVEQPAPTTQKNSSSSSHD